MSERLPGARPLGRYRVCILDVTQDRTQPEPADAPSILRDGQAADLLLGHLLRGGVESETR
jgi:hypothetical protein